MNLENDELEKQLILYYQKHLENSLSFSEEAKTQFMYSLTNRNFD